MKKVLSHGTAQHGRCGSFTALPTHPLVIPQQDITLLENVKKKKKNELSEGTDPHSFNQFFSFYSTVQYSVRVLLHYDANDLMAHQNLFTISWIFRFCGIYVLKTWRIVVIFLAYFDFFSPNIRVQYRTRTCLCCRGEPWRRLGSSALYTL